MHFDLMIKNKQTKMNAKEEEKKCIEIRKTV